MQDEIKVFVINKGRRNLYLLAKRGTRFVAEKSARTARTRDAERAAAVWQRELNDEANPGRGRALGWDDFRTRYVDSREGEVADATLEHDYATFDLFAVIVGTMRPSEIRTEHVDQFRAGLRDGGRAPATVDRHLRHLKAALRWGHRRRIVREVPVFEMNGGHTAKGRPLTGAEFDRMLESVEGVVGAGKAEPWRFLLRGLWTSGLRLSEAMGLHWGDERRIHVDETGKRSVFVFPPNVQKSRKAEIVPCTPEFVDLVADVDREGFVFNPQPMKGSGRYGDSKNVGRIIARMGTAARIVVKPATSDDDEPSYASAHDLRRSFCDRWSRLVTPAVLMKLARHASIQTTMQFYVGHDAQATAEAVFAAVTPVEEQAGDDAADGRHSGRLPTSNAASGVDAASS